MKRTTRSVSSALAVVVLTFAGVISLQSSASASIDGCRGFTGPVSSWTYCDGSRPSSFAQYIVCKFSNGATSPKTGPWRWAGGGARSEVACDDGSSLTYQQTLKKLS
jgi:hypothetical protein